MIRYLRTFLIFSVLTLAGCANADYGGPVLNDKIYGTNVSAYEKGKLEFAAKRFGLASKHFRKAFIQAPGDVQVLNGLAATYDKMSRFDISRRYYQMALKIDPNSPETLNNFGYSYYLQGKHDVAKVLLREAAARSQDQWIGHANLLLLKKASAPAVNINEKFDANKDSGSVKENKYSSIFAAPEIPPFKRTSNSLTKGGTSDLAKNSKRKIRLIRTAAATHTIFTRRRPGMSHNSKPELAAAQPLQSETKTRTPPHLDRLFANTGNEKPANVSSSKNSEPNSPIRQKLEIQEPKNESQSSVSIIISNGTGRSKMAARMRGHLKKIGYQLMWLRNADNYRKRITTVFYKEGWKERAEILAAHLPVAIRLVERTDQHTSLHIELAADLLSFDRQLIRQHKKAQKNA